MVYITYAMPYRQQPGDIYYNLFRQDLTKALHSSNFFHVRTLTTGEPIIKPHITSALNDLTDNLLSDKPEKQFTTFRIPKHSGGTRLIEAPEDAYKHRLRDITDLMQNRLKLLSHDAAYAYSRGRSAKDAIIIHQENKSRWFLKIDLSNFFGTTTAAVLLSKLKQIYPIHYLSDDAMQDLVDYSLNHEGVLPQGSPLSPLLTNLTMIPFDDKLRASLRWFERQKYIYTRYADDLLISCEYKFDPAPIVQHIKDTLAELNYPYTINEDKTRYQSFSGSNWNLGLMYTKDYHITIGTKKKREYAFLLDCFLKDYVNGTMWDRSETSELMGKLGYLKGIEPHHYDKMIARFERKHSIPNVPELFKIVLNLNNM